MKFKFSNFLGTVFMMLMSTSAAFAVGDPTDDTLRPVTLIEITSAYYPGETFKLGYLESENHSIQKFFYDDNGKKTTYYTWEQMNGQVPIIQTTNNGIVYDLLRVSIDQNLDERSYDITLSYLKNAITGSRRIIYLKLAYTPEKSNYELFYGRVPQDLVKRAHAVINYIGGIAVGVDYVQFSK
jgi:hypothetical protein